MIDLASSRLVIHADLLRNNVKQIRAAAPGKTLIAVVKANAYGHGLREVVSTLKREGIEEFAVAFITEAVELRKLLPNGVIHVLHKTLPRHLTTIRTLHLLPTAHSVDDVEMLLKARLPFEVKIDTGMTRLGMLPAEWEQSIQRIRVAKKKSIGGLWTHFSSADDKKSLATTRQIDVFRKAISLAQSNGIALERIHAQNSAAIWNVPLQDVTTHVRPGLSLYGFGPSDREPHGLEPIATWESAVVQVKTIEKGSTVGYNATYRAPKALRVATIPVGYNDGVNRLLSNLGSVLVEPAIDSSEQSATHGMRCRILGRVSMDSIVIDVTECEELWRTALKRGVVVGDRVVLLGRDKAPSGWEWATWCKTIPYEITCRIGNRVMRTTTIAPTKKNT